MGDKNQSPNSTSNIQGCYYGQVTVTGSSRTAHSAHQRSLRNMTKRTVPHISSYRDGNHLCLNSNEPSEDVAVSQFAMLELAYNSLS